MSKDKTHSFGAKLRKPDGYHLNIANVSSVNYIRKDLLPSKETLLNFIPNLNPDTEKEIRIDDDITGIMVDNKIEIVFPDGRNITKFANGRVEQNFCETGLLEYRP